MLNQKIKETNSCIDKVLRQVNQTYKHNEDTYKSVQEALNFILQNCFIPEVEINQAILTLGKTGWGKSTTINYLHGNEVIVVDNQRIVVSDNCDVLTPIGDGSGSTTLFPIFCQTSFGQVCDLPGDQETRGLCVQMINAISKKNMGMILKSIKLLLVIPYPTFSAAGSYGRGLKDILNSNDKFLCGINRFKNNMIIIITSSNRKKNALEEVIKNIHNCLNHPDKELANYEDLLLELISKDRIKLFPLPSSDTDQGIYSLPYHQQWKNHKRQVIVEQIKNLSSKHCSQQDFSVPKNPKIRQNLTKMLTVIVQKIKEQISFSFVSSIISGVELQFYMKFLTLLRSNQKKKLTKYIDLFNTNGYLKSPQLKNCIEYIQFITQFLAQDKGQELIQNWCSKKLEEKIQNVLNTCESIFAEKGGNFRKKIQKEQLILKPNSKKFNQIQQQFNNFRQLYKKVDQLQLDKENINSQLYQDKQVDVYDRTIQVPYQVDENYIEYQNKKIIKKVPKSIKNTRNVTKTRTNYRTQTYTQKQAVQKTRKVTKPVKTGQTSSSTWILFIPVNTRYHDKYENIQMDQAYVDYEDRTKTRSVPYQQNYTVTQDYWDVVNVDEQSIQQVPITKTRKKTLYRDKQLFKKQTHRNFIQKKYDLEKQNGKKMIQSTHQKILTLIDSSEQKQFKDEIKLGSVSVKEQTQNKYFELLKKWCIREHQAFAYYHSGKIMNIQKLKG